jgi:uncharacterized membrane protein
LKTFPGDGPEEQLPPLPPHIEEAVQSIAMLHNAHHKNASRLARLVDFASSQVSRPACLVLIGAATLLWVAANLALIASGLAPFDPPPFAWANDILTLLALVVAVLIVTTQRRAGKLSERREQMTLELTLLTEQKTAKIIALIEEMRRDSPQLANRIDREAREMSAPTDPHLVLGAIEETASEIGKPAPPPAKEFANDK